MDKLEVERKIDVMTTELRKLADEVQTLTETTHAPRGLLCIGPYQLNRLNDADEDGDDLVTVTYPTGSTTVLSVQPDGTLETRPAGACGPYELAILRDDRLVYAPLGPAGAVFLIPFSDVIPNE